MAVEAGVMSAPLRVLVVEDDSDLRDLVCRLLSEAGAIPIGVANAEDAAQTLAAQRIHVIVCDYLLPGRNGATFLHEVRERHPQVRCLAVTGHPDPFILGRGHDDGYYVVTKPVDPSLLLALVGGSRRTRPVVLPAPEAAAHS